jgi:uncharacterized protein (TIGR02145 family)
MKIYLPLIMLLPIAALTAGCAKTEVREVEKIVEEIIEIPGDELVTEGIEWAKTNVGAPGTFAQKPEDYGMFYQWNNPIGWSSVDPMTPHDGTSSWNPVYMSNFPAPEWVPENDPCPQGWRTPTSKEFAILYATTECEWTTLNGVDGYRFHSGGVEIFLPAAGCRTNSGELYNQERFGYYWESDADEKIQGSGFRLLFSNTGIRPFDNIQFAYGNAVRCVRDIES